MKDYFYATVIRRGNSVNPKLFQKRVRIEVSSDNERETAEMLWKRLRKESALKVEEIFKWIKKISTEETFSNFAIEICSTSSEETAMPSSRCENLIEDSAQLSIKITKE